jgi:hypothetical protein
LRNQTNNQLPSLPRKTTTGHKARSATALTTLDGSVTLQSNSTTNFRAISSSGDHINSDEDLVSLPRRKHLSASVIIPPPLPPPRSIVSHSKSLTTIQQPSINLTSRKICTEV